MSKIVALSILGSKGIPAKYGGYETFAEKISAYLASDGYDVTVYCEGNMKPSKLGLVNLVYIPIFNLGPLKTIFYDFLCLVRATRHSDIIIMLGCGSSIFCLYPKIFSKKVFISTDGVEWKRSKWNFFAKLYLRLSEFAATIIADCIIADATAIDKHLRNSYGSRFQTAVLEYGAIPCNDNPNNQFIYSLGLHEFSYALIVCRLEPENHILEILEGFSSSHVSYPLIVVGSIDRPNSYVQRLLKFAGKNIIFVNTIFNKNNLEQLRFYSRVYFHGHSVGGTNPSLLEAMACKNLVVAHDNPFNREVLNTNAFYFKSKDDIPHLLNEIEYSYSSDSLDSMRSFNFKRIIEYYNWDVIGSKYLKLIKSSGASL